MATGDGGDLAVELADRAASGATLGGYGGIGPRGGAVEGQDSVPEVFVQHRLDCLGEGAAAPARWQNRDATEQFGLAHRGKIHLGAVPRGEPRLDLRAGAGRMSSETMLVSRTIT